MERQVNGLHHVTAIAGDPQANIDFYTGVLGLRLVKQTVNFDDPTNYHLYYGNGTGEPGTILTFFPWPGAARGRLGAGQTTSTALSVPTGSLGYWEERLRSHSVDVDARVTRFDSPTITFRDPDGMIVELVEDGVDNREPWDGSNVPVDKAIRGVHHVTLTETNLEKTATVLEQIGYRRAAEEGDRVRFAVNAPGGYVDVIVDPAASHGRVAAGTVHHIAFRTPNDDTQAEWLSTLRDGGAAVSDVRDRQYFNSIYFREPGGVLFEIATDAPGFLVDEPRETLGTNLRLPAWFEPFRTRIAASLPKIDLNRHARA